MLIPVAGVFLLVTLAIGIPAPTIQDRYTQQVIYKERHPGYGNRHVWQDTNNDQEQMGRGSGQDHNDQQFGEFYKRQILQSNPRKVEPSTGHLLNKANNFGAPLNIGGKARAVAHRNSNVQHSDELHEPNDEERDYDGKSSKRQAAGDGSVEHLLNKANNFGVPSEGSSGKDAPAALTAPRRDQVPDDLTITTPSPVPTKQIALFWKRFSDKIKTWRGHSPQKVVNGDQ